MPSVSLWSGQPLALGSYPLDCRSSDSISRQLDELGLWWSEGDQCVLYVSEENEREGKGGVISSPVTAGCTARDSSHILDSPNRLSDTPPDPPHDVSITTDSGFTSIVDLTQSDCTDPDSDAESLASAVGVPEGSGVAHETDCEEADKVTSLLPGLRSFNLGRAVPQVGGASDTGSHTPLIAETSHDVIVVSSSDETITKASTHLCNNYRTGSHSPLITPHNSRNIVVISNSEEAILKGTDASRGAGTKSSHTPSLGGTEQGQRVSGARLDLSLTVGLDAGMSPASCRPFAAGMSPASYRSLTAGLAAGMSPASYRPLPEGGVELNTQCKLLDEEGVGLVKTKGVGLGVDLRKDEGIDTGSESDDLLLVGVEGEEGGGVRDEMITSVLAGKQDDL